MLGLLCALVFLPQNEATRLTPYAMVKNPAIDEMSGMVKSNQFPDTYWVHNDSGDSARIFAIHEDGSSITGPKGIAIDGAKNHDWEDLTIDGNTLYIADLGNNNNARRDLAIYSVQEPDPKTTDRTSVLKRFPVAYREQAEFPPAGRKQFDCEAIFSLRGKLYLISKNRYNALLPDVSANLYRMDTMDTDKVNYPTKIDSMGNLDGWVTAADVSPDGKTLAVLTNLPAMSIWLFRTDAAGDQFFSKGHRRQILLANAKQCESIAWKNSHTVIVGNEESELFKVNVLP